MSVSVDDHLVAGRYRLDEADRGREIRRAWDTLLRRPVALRFVDSSPGVENGIRTLAALQHPALPQVYDAGAGYVVTHYAGPRTLAGTPPLPLPEVRRIGVRLADALAHLHSYGLVHRDLQPATVRIDASDEPCLADFSPWSGVQGVGYLSPEQVRGQRIGPASDVYALGLVLLECLTGHQEYGTPEERLRRPPVVPRTLPPGVVRELSLMTALSPRRRPAAGECARRLREVDLTRVGGRVGRRLAAASVTAVLGLGGALWASHSASPTISAPAPDSSVAHGY
ncbi:serine/threonine-protein kinase [Saccharothrix violaceirubra]|uniref:Serine/threonine protein kinase n=1 Tax=Saccharothrix violaceirubra TaxID=413306 RepID=A0A7W7T4J7_9PSEU|nr:serine/threonine-protein kinase [Saccharothrix violaceirubra]MBB4965205.1 serine/threonine protein kinase [Saccharothrix violaceirubra]